jgi:hypothetical protein
MCIEKNDGFEGKKKGIKWEIFVQQFQEYQHVESRESLNQQVGRVNDVSIN